MDLSQINVAGTFYFLTSVLDGHSRYIVQHELREVQTELDVRFIVQQCLEESPGESPRTIFENGSQFSARDFKRLIRTQGLTHARTRPYDPQSNG